MTEQIILVPQISSVPAHEAKARQLLSWLVKREIVEALPTTCGRGGNGMNRAPLHWARSAVFAVVLAVLATGAMSWYASPMTSFLLADAWLLCAGLK